MEDAVAQGGAVPNAKDAPFARGAQLPLSFLKTGQTAVVAKVRGKEELHHHLENLGFVEGAEVRIINEIDGNLIVEIKGAQIALDKQVATKVITQ